MTISLTFANNHDIDKVALVSHVCETLRGLIIINGIGRRQFIIVFNSKVDKELKKMIY